ncbi:putative glucokinase [Thelonectria olida]|uniref:Phosphotransferase n=1 Tax=Thelonectria olida TaxID=1576542 RepID=A0A9P9AKV4_9HYPO|nr:putative glucokinase [Thelonectria olida]
MMRLASSDDLLVRAEEIAGLFDIGTKDVTKITKHFVQHMKNELSNNGATQIPTFVTKMPTGCEKGLFLAVDLGGTNCRVCSVDLHGDSSYTLRQSKQTIPRHVMVNRSHKPLFNFVAEEIKSFLHASHSEYATLHAPDQRPTLKLGFTFSFTYENTSLSHGTMLQWDKGWDIPDALGRDPCEMLQTAIDELALPVQVSALVSDSVGTLVSRSYTSPANSETLIGAIFGTGTNAAYVERLSNVHKLDNHEQFQDSEPQKIMIINTEWGAFDENMVVLPSNDFDDMLDAASSNPKRQIFEKRVSGLYLGELLRLVIVTLMDKELFQMAMNGNSPLTIAYAVDSSFLTSLARESSENLVNAKTQVEETLKVQGVSQGDVQAIRMMARAIARRSARLAAAALAATIIQSGRLTSVGSSPCSSTTSVNGTKKKSMRGDAEVSRKSLNGFRKALSHINRLVRKILGTLRLLPTDTSTQGSFAGRPEGKHCGPREQLIDIGIDGSLFEFYPAFEDDIHEALREVPDIGTEGLRRITMGLTKDGSGVGAALVAQLAHEVETLDN